MSPPASLSGPSSAAWALGYYMIDAYRVFPALLARYGDPFFLPLPGSSGTVVTGCPDGVRAIVGADPDAFEPWRIEATTQLLGEESLFLQKGERHRAARKLLTPPFSAQRVRTAAKMMREIARAGLEPWRRGGRHSVQDTVQGITLAIIVRALFGAAGARAEELGKTLAAGLDSLGPGILYIKALRREYGGFGPWARALRTVGRMRALLAEEIEIRRAGGGPGDDVLSGLVAARYDDGSAMRDDEIRDRLSDIVVAGHETSAVAIAWAVDELTRHADVRARLVAELDTLDLEADPGAVAALPYLDAVCHEVLRLHPPLVFLTRKLVRPLELLGHRLEPGLGVSMALYAVHTHAATFAAPLEFRPERFLDQTYAAHEFLPFGGGAKRCIGAAFGLAEMKQILFEMLRGFELHAVSTRAARPAARTITVAPRGGVPVVVGPRLAQRPPRPSPTRMGTVRAALAKAIERAAGSTSPPP
jgi:cytochrome P450